MELIKKCLTTKNIVFIIGIILFLIFITQMKDIAIMVFASFVIACSLNPLVDKLTSKFNRSKAVSIVLGGSIALLLVCFIPLIILLLNQIKDFALSFPQYIYKLDAFLKTTPLPNLAQIDFNQLISSMYATSSSVMDNIINIGTNLGSAFVYLIASTMMIYYLMVDRDLIKKTYLRLFPKDIKPKAKNLFEIITRKIGGYIIGQGCAIASVGIIMTIGLFLIKVDYALLLGLITAILDIIPVVGPCIALVICLVATSNSGILISVLVAVIFAIAQLVENNVVRPYAFGKLLDVHPIMIYIFLFITAKYLGIIGVVFAPALAATFCVLVEELYIKNLEDKNNSNS